MQVLCSFFNTFYVPFPFRSRSFRIQDSKFTKIPLPITYCASGIGHHRLNSDADLWMNSNMRRSTSVSSMPRRPITTAATLKNWSTLTSVNPAGLPVWKLGMNGLGKPAPWKFTPTPTTVAVLNMVLMAALLWSPMIRPQNCRSVFMKPRRA